MPDQNDSQNNPLTQSSSVSSSKDNITSPSEVNQNSNLSGKSTQSTNSQKLKLPTDEPISNEKSPFHKTLADDTPPPPIIVQEDPTKTTPTDKATQVASPPTQTTTNQIKPEPLKPLQKPMVTSPPKTSGGKKWGSKRIATILGVFLLVGGVAAGVLLIQQNQDIRERAAGDWCNPPPPDRQLSVCSPEGATACGADGVDTICMADGYWHATGQCCGEPPGGGDFDLYQSGSCIKADNSTGGQVSVMKACFICSGTANDGCSDSSGDYLQGRTSESCGAGGPVAVPDGANGFTVVCAPSIQMCENYQIDANVIGGGDSEAIVGDHPTQGGACQPGQPTGNFSAACSEPQPQSGLSYTLRSNNFQGDGGFESTTFFLSFNGPYDSSNPVDNYLGTPTWQSDGWHGYQIYKCQAPGCNPVSGEVVKNWDTTSGIKLGSNQRSIDDIVSWTDSNLDPSYRYTIGANLVMGGVQNDGIGSAKIEIAPYACSEPPPTPTPGGALCQDIRAYQVTGGVNDPKNWTPLTASNLPNLTAGEEVYFTLRGWEDHTDGDFDKAEFTINGVARTQVTTIKPSAANDPLEVAEFYDVYTIPSGVKSFVINARIHHAILGWF